MKDKWFAIRTTPGATKISRADSRITNIEHSLARAGMEYYFPVELAVKVHRRTKEVLDKRFPLMPGYVFVCNVQSWSELRKVHFVADAVRICGKPMIIPNTDMENIRKAEQDILSVFESKKAQRVQAISHKLDGKGLSARKARQVFPAGAPMVVSGSHWLRGMKGRVVEATGRNTIKAIIDTLNGAVNVEISVEHLEMVA